MDFAAIVALATKFSDNPSVERGATKLLAILLTAGWVSYFAYQKGYTASEAVWQQKWETAEASVSAVEAEEARKAFEKVQRLTVEHSERVAESNALIRTLEQKNQEYAQRLATEHWPTAACSLNDDDVGSLRELIETGERKAASPRKPARGSSRNGKPSGHSAPSGW